MKKNKIRFLSVLSVVLALVIGGVLGSQLFPKTETEYISNDEGDYCFYSDPTVYFTGAYIDDVTPYEAYDNIVSVSGYDCLTEHPYLLDTYKWCFLDYVDTTLNHKAECVCVKK